MTQSKTKDHSPPVDDVALARDLIKQCMEELSLPETTDGNQFSFPELHEPVSPEFLLAVKIKSADGNYYLGLRFFDDDGIRITDAVYDPLSAMLGFIGKARKFWEDKIPSAERAKWVNKGAVDMLHGLLSILRPTMLDAMGSLSWGVYTRWATDWVHEIERASSLKGTPIRFDHKAMSRSQKDFLKGQQEFACELFLGPDQRQGAVSSEQKKLLVKAYRGLVTHWDRVRKIYSDSDPAYDWRTYAKSGHSDTPDDLLGSWPKLAAILGVGWMSLSATT